MNQQVTGQIVAMEQRNAGWVAVSILEPGKQYPKKLSTKREELIGQAQQMMGMGQIVTAAFNEQQSDQINPHNGQPYTNRYLEALALGMADLVGMPTQIQPQQYMPPQPQPVQQAPYQQPAPVQQPVMQQPIQRFDPTEAKIHRQTATKVAVLLLPMLREEDRNLASLVRISEQLVKYYDAGVQWQTAPIQPQPSPQPQPQQQAQGYEQYDGYPEASPDDDIPF